MTAENPRLKFYEIIKTFKEQIVNLLGDSTLSIDPEDRKKHIRKFNNIYDKLMLVKSTNSRLVIEVFYRDIFIPFGEQILSQNDEFFLKNRHQLLGEDIKNDMGLGDLIEGISNIWPQLDSNNKKTIWRYVMALCKVADIVMGDARFDQLKASMSK